MIYFIPNLCLQFSLSGVSFATNWIAFSYFKFNVFKIKSVLFIQFPPHQLLQLQNTILHTFFNSISCCLILLLIYFSYLFILLLLPYSTNLSFLVYCFSLLRGLVAFLQSTLLIAIFI